MSGRAGSHVFELAAESQGRADDEADRRAEVVNRYEVGSIKPL